MSDSIWALAEPLLKEVVPRSACWGGKVVTLLSLLLGLGLVVLSTVSGHLLVPESIISMPVITPSHHQVVGRTTFWKTPSLPFPRTGFPEQQWKGMHVSSAQRARLVQRGSMQVSAMAPVSRDLDKLLSDNADVLKDLAPIIEGAEDKQDFDDVWLLGFVLANPGDVPAAKAAATSAFEWITGKGKPVYEAAKQGYKEATKDEFWAPRPAWKNALHASKVVAFIGASGDEVMHAKTAWGDVLYIIRESVIDAKKLMGEVSVDELTEFFLYIYELNARVVRERAKKTRQVCQVVNVDDLGMKEASDSAGFRKAISDAAAQAAAVHPLWVGPTVVLNMQVQKSGFNMFKKEEELLREQVANFFPSSVDVRVENGPLMTVKSLQSLKAKIPATSLIDALDAMQPSAFLPH